MNEKASPQVIDISKHQGSMNFADAKKNKIKAVMIRAAYGDTKDPKLDEFYNGAKSAGLSVGAYIFATWHYSGISKNFEQAKENAVKQTRSAIRHLSGKVMTAPVAVDLELEQGYRTNLTKYQLTAALSLALEEIKKAGFTPAVYASASWLEDKIDPFAIKAPIWAAYYYEKAERTPFPDTRYGKVLKNLSGRIFLWQYSSRGDGRLYGASSDRIDLNFSYNDSLMGISKDNSDEVPLPKPPKKQLYTIKIRTGSWYIRKRNTVDSEPLHILRGGITTDASQKKNGWFYITEYKGWIGPAAIESSVYNQPNAVYHTVKQGETLTGIAALYGTDISAIIAKNKSAYPKITPDYIQTGWRLKVKP